MSNFCEIALRGMSWAAFVALKQKVIAWANNEPDLWRHMASLSIDYVDCDCNV